MMVMQKTLFLDKTLLVPAAIVKKRKVVFKSYCQHQDFLLPKNMSEYVTPGHIARVISDIIDKMNIDSIVKTYFGGGTSSYNPRMLLKAWCLGFINKTYTCRLLAKQLRENLTFIWVSGNQQPDFRTLNNFRLRLGKGMKVIFKEIVQYGLVAGIIDGKDVFVDHTKKAANANRYKVVWRKQVEKQSKKIDEELDKLFDYIDQLNNEETEVFGNKDLPEQERTGFDKEQVKKIVERINEQMKNGKLPLEKGREAKKNVRRAQELVEKKQEYKNKKAILGNRNSYSKTDTGAVAMMMKDKITVRPAYNEGVAVENGFVLGYVISNNCADNVSFKSLMDNTIDNLERIPENGHADSAYGTEENHAYFEEKGIKNFLKYNTYHIEKTKKWNEKIHANNFTYDEQQDEFTCKNNVRLKLVDKTQEASKTGYTRTVKKYRAETGHCMTCPFRAMCTKSETRTLELSWNAERLKAQAKQNLESEKGLELRKKRGNEVESIFGDAKLNKAQQRYLLRGLEKVNTEAGLYYLTHNLRRIHTLFLQKTRKQNQPAEEKTPTVTYFFTNPCATTTF